MFLENIKEAITSIFSNKMRSILTMLGIIIGISAVITITTIGNSIQTTLTSTLNSRVAIRFRHMWMQDIRKMMRTGIPGNTRK